jgi:DNA-binding protein YbaB
MIEHLMEQMKSMMVASQRELDELIIEVEKEGVKVSCTGNKLIKDIAISDSLFQEGNKEKMEDLLLAAVTEALEKAESKSKEAVNGIAGGLIPGGLGELF